MLIFGGVHPWSLTVSLPQKMMVGRYAFTLGPGNFDWWVEGQNFGNEHIVDGRNPAPLGMYKTTLDIYHINWCRISSINSIISPTFESMIFLFSQVGYVMLVPWRVMSTNLTYLYQAFKLNSIWLTLLELNTHPTHSVQSWPVDGGSWFH